MRQPTVVASRRDLVTLAPWLAVGLAAAVSLVDLPRADACGCFSPPVPTLGENDYAVNQQSEQIIFEVDPPWITAHVLISYSGDPASFAWLVPVPEAPQLGLSPASAFGLLDRETRPDVSVNLRDICPVSAWACQYHPSLSCGDDDDSPSPGLSDAGNTSDAGGAGGADPVTVIATEVVGDYQTVTFTASQAQAAVTWLRDNGFIVNATTAPYMEPYVEANMVFVAAKLVPGADASSIKPLRMKYRSPFPMIPLVLTAVAADPHLMVTAQIYAGSAYKPLSHPLTTVAASRLAQDASGRVNYPMALARAVDEAGGDAFVAEYRGPSIRPDFGQGSFCCGNGFDSCGLGFNDQCECPRDAFDQDDCSKLGDLLEGVELLDRLAADHPRLTRLTTRISAEEMSFDPTFGPDVGAPSTGRLTLSNNQPTLAACADQVIDQARYAAIDALQACSTVYCGAGECEVAGGAGACACDAGTVARRFNDADGRPSVTCVPTRAPVDLGAGGLALPDACAGVDCGMGACKAINGIAHCACDGGTAAVAGDGAAPRCLPIDSLSRSPGAEDFSQPLLALSVCAPAAPTCGPTGWLERVGSPRPGVDCGNAAPSPEQLIVPPTPTCDEGSPGIYGCAGCETGGGGAPLGAIIGGLFVGGMILRRRRR